MSEPANGRAIVKRTRRERPRSRLVDGELVYAIGDIHGRYDLLVALLETISADLATHGGGVRPLMVFLGDYVDRGADSDKVLSALVWMRARADFEVHLLKGNHEEVLLDFIDRPVVARDWLRFGGDATLRSYGIEPPDIEASIDDLIEARDALLDRMPAAHLRLLQTLEMSVAVGDYAFVHAGARPGVPLRRQSVQDLLWIRDEFLGRDHRFDRIVVHGHTWYSDEPIRTGNRIGIDTGAYRTGVLTALRLEDGDVRFIQTRGEPAPE